MSSIIKVDTIQNAAGGTPTAGDLGLNTTGSVLQVKEFTFTTLYTITTSTFTSVGSGTITPISSSSKILVYCHNHVYITTRTTAGSWRGANMRILRNSSSIYEDTDYGIGAYLNDTQERWMDYHTWQLLDSPSTTSQITYESQWRPYGSGTTVDILVNNPAYGAGGKMILTEVAG